MRSHAFGVHVLLDSLFMILFFNGTLFVYRKDEKGWGIILTRRKVLTCLRGKVLSRHVHKQSEMQLSA